MKVGVAGLGTIGMVVVRALDGGIDGLALAAVCSRDRAKAERNLAGLRSSVAVVSPAELAQRAEVVVECVPKAAFVDIARPALEAGRLLITVSGAGLLAHPEIVDLAKRHGGRIILATGALLGLDAVRAAAGRPHRHGDDDHPQASGFAGRCTLSRGPRHPHRQARGAA